MPISRAISAVSQRGVRAPSLCHLPEPFGFALGDYSPYSPFYIMKWALIRTLWQLSHFIVCLFHVPSWTFFHISASLNHFHVERVRVLFFDIAYLSISLHLAFFVFSFVCVLIIVVRYY